MKKSPLDLRVLTLSLLSLVNVDSLRCWHCIAHNCADDPSDNYRASEKLCNPGQSCQKVYFEMVEVTKDGEVIHKSTVRGCSTNCIERNDFMNCTEIEKTSRGCVRKDCCDDKDFCNSANDTRTSKCLLPFAVIILFVSLLHKNIRIL